MRIVGGEWRGRALAEPGRTSGLRPTADRVRESVFNLLAGGRHGDPVSAARILDLFAGTGALGLEALSRGAAQCVFVESGRAARALLSRNIDRLGAGDRADILPADATRLQKNSSEPARLVFLDPPYGRDLGTRALIMARRQGWIADSALIIWEEQAPQSAPGGFAGIEQRRYGDTWITVLRAQPLGQA